MASMSDFISDLIHLADNEKLNNAIKDKKEADVLKLLKNHEVIGKQFKDKSEYYLCFKLKNSFILHQACRNGWIEVSRYLIDEFKFNIHLKNQSQHTPFHMACESGNFDLVKLLLDQYNCKNIRVSENDDLLSLALKSDNQEIFYCLLEHGFDPNNGNTCLFSEIIDKGFLVLLQDLVTKFHYIPLMNGWALRYSVKKLCKSGNVKFLRYLFEHCDNFGHWASENMSCVVHPDFDEDVISYIINERGFDPNLVVDNSTILVHACKQNKLAKIKFLIEKCKCDPAFEYKCSYSPWESPLLVTCRSGYTDIFNYLIHDCKLLQLCKGDNGRSLLNATSVKHTDIISVLIKLSEVNSTEIVCRACETGDVAIVNNVIKASKYKRSSCKMAVCKSPLFIACLLAHMDVVNLLYNEHGCRMSLEGEEDEVILLLMKAIKYKNLQILKFIFEKCDSSKKFRLDAIFYSACASGDLAIVKYMISSLSDYSHQLVDSTVLVKACESKSIELVKYLIETMELDRSVNLTTATRFYTDEKCFPLLEYFLDKIDISSCTTNPKALLPLLMSVCEAGDSASMKALVSKYDQTFPSNFDTESLCLLLSITCRRRHFELARYILKFISDENIKLQSNELLSVIYTNGFDEIIKELIKDEICDPIQPVDNQMNTLLHLACSKDDLSTVQFLLNSDGYCVSLSQENSEGSTPLRRATTGYHCTNLIVASYIIINFYNDCKIEQMNDRLFDILDTACKEKKIDLVKFMIKKRLVSSTTVDKNGDTLLHRACFYCDTHMLNYLVKEEKWPLRIQNRSGDTPIHIACGRSTLTKEMFEFIFSFGHCCFGIGNKKDFTPMHIAVDETNYFLAFCLFEKVQQLGREKKDIKNSCCLLLQILSNRNHHLIVLQHFLSRIKLHVDSINLDETLTDDGKTLSQTILESGNLYLIKYCIQRMNMNPFKWSIHNIVRSRHFYVLKYLALNFREQFLNAVESDQKIKNALINDLDFKYAYSILQQIDSKHFSITDDAGNTMLHLACRSERLLGLVEQLISTFHLDPMKENVHGITPLSNACSLGHMKIVKCVLEKRQYKTNTMLLFNACNSTNLDLVKYLFSKESSASHPIKDKDGNSLLHQACTKENYRLVCYLVLEQNYSPLYRNTAGISPLESVCSKRCLSIFGFFASLTDCKNECKSSASIQHYTMDNADSSDQVFSILKILKRLGCNLDMPDRHGKTLLHKCAARSYSFTELALFLVDNCDCDPLKHDSDGNSFLSLEINDGTALYDVLKKYKFKTIPQDAEAAAILFYAYNSSNFQFEDIKHLIKEGFDSKSKDKNGVTLLQKACNKGDSQMVQFLLTITNCNDLICKEDSEGKSPLEISLNNTDPIIFETLVEHSKLENPTMTLISLLEKKNVFVSISVLRILITKYNCDPKQVKDYDGKSIVHKACQAGNIKLLKFLIEECNLDPNCTNWQGKLPLHDVIECCSSYDTTCRIRVDYLVDLLDGTKIQDDKDLVDVACAKNIDVLHPLLVKGKCRPGKKYLVTHCASNTSNLRVFKYVLEHHNHQNELFDKCNSNNETAIHVALMNTPVNFSFINYLVEHFSGMFQVSHEKPLLNCAYNIQSFEVMRWLIETVKCNPKSEDKDGITLLHLACLAGDFVTVKYLIEEQKCNPNKKDHNGLNCFNKACASGNITLVKYFQANHKMYEAKYREPVLHSALKHNHYKLFYLLKREGDLQLNSVDKQGNSLLHLACSKGNLPLLDQLKLCLRKGLLTMNNENRTPFHLACEKRNYAVIKFLLTNFEFQYDGAKLSNILHISYSSTSTDRLDFLRFMVTSARCNVNAIDENGDSLLHLAASAGDLSFCIALCEEFDCKVTINAIGLSPLHCASNSNSIQVIKYFMTKHKDKYAHLMGSSFLHTIDFKIISIEVFDYLIHEMKCDVSYVDDGKNTLLHKACAAGNLDIVKHLVLNFQSDCFSFNKFGRNTPLHEMGNSKLKNLEIISFLLSNLTNEQKDSNSSIVSEILILNLQLLSDEISDVDIQIIECLIKNGYSKLQHASNAISKLLKTSASKKHFKLLKCLILGCNTGIRIFTGWYSIYTTDLLHFCCDKRYYECLKYLITECKCDPSEYSWSSVQDMNPLTFACSVGDQGLIRFLHNQCKSNDLFKEHGKEALNVAFQKEHDDTVIYLLNKCGLDSERKIITYQKCYRARMFKLLLFLCSESCDEPIIDESTRETLLHCACSTADIEMVKFLIEKCNCSTTIKDKEGNTPLFYAKHDSILEYLITTGKVDLKNNDVNNNTPLHLVCSQKVFNSSTFEYILATGEVDPFHVNNNKQTALQLLKEKNDQDTYTKLITKLKNYKSSHPVDSFVNIFILGHPGAGKSTLTRAVIEKSKQRSRIHRFVVGKSVRSNKVLAATAGMIPNVVNDGDLQNVIVNDFAGHIQYHSSHLTIIDHLIKKSSAVFVLLINLTDEDRIDQLNYWITLIDAKRKKLSIQSKLIVIASHCDKKAQQEQDDDSRRIITALTNRRYTQGYEYELILHDCCSGLQSKSDIIVQLRNACQLLREKQNFELSLYSCSLYAFLEEIQKIDQKNEQNSVYQLKDFASKNEYKTYEACLPRKTSELSNLCEMLDHLGLIMFLKNSQSIGLSWVVIDRGLLLTNLTGLMFLTEDMIDPNKRTYFKDFPDLASETGVVVSCALTKLSEDLNLPMQLIIDFLLRMEFCLNIPKGFFQHSSLKPKSKCKEPKCKKHTFLFFPALNFKGYPGDERHNFKLGWCLRCSENYFFLSNDIHFLILRLAYDYAVSNPLFHGSMFPELHRSCNIFKNGIQWILPTTDSEDGLEVIVEFTENCRTLVLLMSGENKHVKMKSKEIITTILSLTKNDSLPKTEYVLHLQDLKYPLQNFESVKLYDIRSVILSISLNSQSCVDSKNGHIEPLNKLLPFENLSSESIKNLSILAGRDPQVRYYINNSTVTMFGVHGAILYQ